MKKVMVIGCPGAGKSHFSRELAAKTGLPLIPLDLHYHRDVWSPNQETKKAQWRAKVSELAAGESWILDGNYRGSFDIRMPAADTIIYLDYPRWLTIGRAFKRRIEYQNRRRPDMPEEWKEKISWDFLKFMWTYNRAERPKMLSLLEGHAEGKDIHIFTSPAQARLFLTSI